MDIETLRKMGMTPEQAEIIRSVVALPAAGPPGMAPDLPRTTAESSGPASASEGPFVAAGQAKSTVGLESRVAAMVAGGAIVGMLGFARAWLGGSFHAVPPPRIVARAPSAGVSTAPTGTARAIPEGAVQVDRGKSRSRSGVGSGHRLGGAPRGDKSGGGAEGKRFGGGIDSPVGRGNGKNRQGGPTHEHDERLDPVRETPSNGGGGSRTGPAQDGQRNPPIPPGRVDPGDGEGPVGPDGLDPDVVRM